MIWKMKWTFIYVLLVVSVLPTFDENGPALKETIDMPAIRQAGEIPPAERIQVVHADVCSPVCLDLSLLCSRYGSTPLYMITQGSDTAINKLMMEPNISYTGRNSFMEPMILDNEIPVKLDDVGITEMIINTNYNISQTIAAPVISGVSCLYRKLTYSLLPCIGDVFIHMFGIKHGDFGANVKIPDAMTRDYDDDKYAREIDKNYRFIGIVYDTLYVSTILLYITVVTAFCAKQEKLNKKRNKKCVKKEAAPEPPQVKCISKSKRRKLKRQEKAKLERLAKAEADVSEHEDSIANESDNETLARKDLQDVTDDVTYDQQVQEVVEVPKPAIKLTRRQKRNLREKAKLAKMAEQEKVEVEPASESEDDEEPEPEVKLTKSQKRNLRRKRNAELMKAKLQDSE